MSSLTFSWVLLNVAYLVYTISALFKEILALRSMWLAATTLFMVYGLVESNLPFVFWNIPVAILHVWALWRLFQARRGIDLDDEAEAIHTLLFPSLDRVAFNQLWQWGRKRTVQDGEMLIVQGEEVAEMSLIMTGEVAVEINGEMSARLGHIRLIGEISTLRDSAATATVRAFGSAELRVWRKADLDKICTEYPEIEVALLTVMAREAARKLNTTDERP